MDIEAGEVHDILVVQVSRIGDTLLATPALRTLAAAFPEARLSCLAHPNRVEVLQGLPCVHHLGCITKKSAPLRGWLPGLSYDLALVFGFDQPLVAYALRVAHRVVAFRQGNPALDARLWRAVEEPAFQSRHAVDYQLALTDAIGLPSAGKYLSYVVSAAEREWASTRLAPLRTSRARPLIGLQIASFPTKGYRDWPVAHFIELCRRIRTEHPRAHFLIFGGNMELERTQTLHAALPDCSTHYAGSLSLRQTAALMNEVDLYVGVDTGPTHIMGALHRPMVAMYHGSSPSHLLAPLEHPCLWTVDHPRAGQGTSPDDYPMSDVSVDTVLDRVREALV
jgi:heptosyltransferase-3